MKKVKEFGKDLFGINYSMYIENGVLHVSLNCNEGLSFEYRLYDVSALISKKKYSNDKSVSFELCDFGNYRVRVYVKNPLDSNYEYSFLTEYLEYTEKTAYNYFKEDENNCIALKNIKNAVIKKNDKDKNVDLMIEKLSALNSMKSNIFDNFKKNIVIYADQNESIIAKLVWLNARYNKEIECKLISKTTFHDKVSIPKKITLKYEKYTDLVFDKDDVILVCTSVKDRDLLDKLKKDTNVEVYHLTDIIEKSFTYKSIIEPLINVKNNNPGVALIVGLLPTLKKVKNKSLEEQKILKEKIELKDIRNEFSLYKTISRKSIERFKLSTKDMEELIAPYYRIKKDGIYYLEDRMGDNVNVINGFRVTVDQPSNYKRTVYIFGNSVVFGLGSDDSNTITSHLQKLINKYFGSNESICIVNCANFASADYDHQFDLMNKINYKKNDIIISLFSKNIFEYCKDRFTLCDMRSEFDRPHSMGEIFIDMTHINMFGNKKIAECLYDSLLENNCLDENYSASEMLLDNKTTIIPASETENLKMYKELLLSKKSSTKGRIGSIVMNCNPFTLGHRYLIETSSKKVDHLYIFVVEEDKSYFPFKDRLDLIKKGTSDLGNVTVIPSGKFIISSLTFSDYFNKEKLSEKNIDVANDVTIFATEIAPVLDINIRFVGEEPLCKVTNQYNNTMKMILPMYGIDVEIIERKEEGNEPISASRVRHLLEDRKFREIKKLVPLTTYSYLINKFERVK